MKNKQSEPEVPEHESKDEIADVTETWWDETQEDLNFSKRLIKRGGDGVALKTAAPL